MAHPRPYYPTSGWKLQGLSGQSNTVHNIWAIQTILFQLRLNTSLRWLYLVYHKAKVLYIKGPLTHFKASTWDIHPSCIETPKGQCSLALTLHIQAMTVRAEDTALSHDKSFLVHSIPPANVLALYPEVSQVLIYTPLTRGDYGSTDKHTIGTKRDTRLVRGLLVLQFPTSNFPTTVAI